MSREPLQQKGQITSSEPLPSARKAQRKSPASASSDKRGGSSSKRPPAIHRNSTDYSDYDADSGFSSFRLPTGTQIVGSAREDDRRPSSPPPPPPPPPPASRHPSYREWRGKEKRSEASLLDERDDEETGLQTGERKFSTTPSPPLKSQSSFSSLKNNGSGLFGAVVRLGGYLFNPDYSNEADGDWDETPKETTPYRRTSSADSQDFGKRPIRDYPSREERRAAAVDEFEMWASEHCRSISTGIGTPIPTVTLLDLHSNLNALTGRRRKPQLLLFFLRSVGLLPIPRNPNRRFRVHERQLFMSVVFLLMQILPYVVFYASVDENKPRPPVDDLISDIAVIVISTILMQHVLVALNHVYTIFTKPEAALRDRRLSRAASDASAPDFALSQGSIRLAQSFQNDLDNYTWFWSFMFLAVSLPIFFIVPIFFLSSDYQCQEVADGAIPAFIIWIIGGPLWSFFGSGMLTSILVVFIAHLRELQLLRGYIEQSHNEDVDEVETPHDILERSKGLLKNHLEAEARINFSSERTQGMLLFLIAYALVRVSLASFKLFFSTCIQASLQAVGRALFYTSIAVIGIGFASHITVSCDSNIELIHRKFIDSVMFAMRSESSSSSYSVTGHHELSAQEAYAHHSFIQAYKGTGGFKLLNIRISPPVFLGFALAMVVTFCVLFKYIEVLS